MSGVGGRARVVRVDRPIEVLAYGKHPVPALTERALLDLGQHDDAAVEHVIEVLAGGSELGGLEADGLGGLGEEEDLNAPVKESVRKRLPWLILLLFLGMESARKL